MALLANQIMDARLLSSMNGRVELSHFLRVTNPNMGSQVNSPPDDNHKNRKYPCPLCGKRFRFNSILSLHMRTHTGEKPFKCPYCDHRAAQKGNLKIHLRTHKQGILGKGRGRIREENRLLHELEERAILRDRQMRTSHVPTNANANQQQSSPLAQTVTVQSQICSSADISPHTSTSPVAQVQDEPSQPMPSGFRCSFCKGKFRKQQELERHIRILHKPYKCTLCEFAASQEEELIGHVETAHITAESNQGSKAPMVGSSDKGKPAGEFPCEVCGQTFTQAWFLKGHMRKHKDSFEHCCQICGRRFKEPWFLKNHMKVHLNKLAAKTNLSDHDNSLNMLTQEHPSSLYSQYMSRIHNRFLSGERDHPDYNHMLGVDVKVREMLQRMMSPSTPMTDVEMLGLNHLHSSPNMEYLQKVIANNNNSSSGGGGYPGWQIMTPGLASDQLMFTAKSQQSSSYQSGDGDPDNKAISRASSPGNLSHHPSEIIAETGNSHSSSSMEHTPQSASPATGEKIYRCPPSSDYTLGQSSSAGIHLDRYPFSPWQSTTDLSSPLQPTNSPSKLPPRSREDFSPAASHYIGLDNENALLMKNFPVIQKDMDSSQARKSQYEPLDLSVRPDSVPSLMQMPCLFTNGLTSSMTSRLQSFGAAFHSDLKTKNDTDLADLNCEAEKTETAKETENNDWKKNNILESTFQSPGEKPDPAGHWGRAITESPISSLESLTPGQALSLQHQVGLLSFLRSQVSLTSSKTMVNGGGTNDAASARKPFQCRYCPYSASQKGNLKTHVLCVHRKPFDNSLYPDRRLRRSHAPQRPSRLAQSISGDNHVPARDQIGMTSLCGT